MEKLKQTAVLVLAILAFFLVFIGWSWYARQVNSDPSRNWVGIVPFGGALLTARTLYVLVARRRDASTVALLLAAERGESRRNGETCATLGELHGREDATLPAPFSGEPCVLYRYDVSRLEPGGGEVSHGRNHPMACFGRAMAPCEIRTGHGAVALRAFPSFSYAPRWMQGQAEAVTRASAFLASCTFRDLSTSVTWDDMAAAEDAALAPLVLATDGGRCDFWFQGLLGRVELPASDLSRWGLREMILRPGTKVWATGVWSEEGQGLGSGEGAFAPSLELRIGEPGDFLRTAEDALRLRADALRRLVVAQIALAAITAAF